MGRVVFLEKITRILRLLLFSVTPASIIGGFLIPLTLLSLFLLFAKLMGGLWVCHLHTVYIQRLGRGNNQTGGLVGRCLLYQQLLQLI
jgi:ABC-type Na+ efflux pump permease subunit